MKINQIVKTMSLLAIGLACLGCPLETPTIQANVTHFVHGAVIDSVDHCPVAGVNIAFGSQQTVTDAAGRFTFTLTGGGLQSGPLSYYRSGYIGRYVNPVSVDAGKDSDCELTLSPTDTAGYPVKTIQGKIFQSDGVTEIGPVQCQLTIYSSNGSSAWGMGMGYSNGYSMTTQLGDSYCIMRAALSPVLNEITDHVYLFDVDLSGPETLYTIDFVLPSSPQFPAVNNVTVTPAKNTGNNTVGFYYNLPGTVVEVLSQSGTSYGAARMTFTGETSCVFNPVNVLPGASFSLQQASSVSFMGYSKWIFSTTGAIPFPAPNASYNLPAVPESAPAGLPNAASITYANGSLSVDAVAEATSYYFRIYTPGAAAQICQVASTGPSVALPAWLQTQLSGQTVDIRISVSWTDTPTDPSNYLDNLGPKVVSQSIMIQHNDFIKTGIVIP